jgi:CDP-diacylglycerol---serine O-phosphatidyltransferase
MSDLFPPFDPEPALPKKRRFKPIPFRLVAPNLVTLLSLCLGLTAMRLVVEGRLEVAVYCIMAAAALDGIDGRLARLLKGTSRFGEQLDSLADFVNFGVAPCFILYHFVLKDLRSFGWICALIYAIATCLRLARFNVMIDDPNRPDWKKNYFTGVPSPLGALLVLLPVYLSFLGVSYGPKLAVLVAFYTVFVGYMMVSNLPIFAAKTLGVAIPRTAVLPIFGGVVAFVALLVSYPFEVLTAMVIAYFAVIPFSIRAFKANERSDVATTTGKVASHAVESVSETAPPKA